MAGVGAYGCLLAKQAFVHSRAAVEAGNCEKIRGVIHSFPQPAAKPVEDPDAAEEYGKAGHHV